MKKLFNTFN